MMILFVFFLLLLDRGSSEVENLTYSFRVPGPWGELTLEDAQCCPRHFHVAHKNKSFTLPDIIGLGVQKGGSTSVSQYMSRHPNYVMSWPKETHYFDLDWKYATLAGYEGVWGKRGNATTLRFEFTPSYLWIPFTACRIKGIFPDMKFIVILRDPADRAYSEFDMVRTRCRGTGDICSWIHSDFFEYLKKGMRYLEKRECTFNDGLGNKTWNDCFQCLIYNPKFRKVCQYRPYYISINEYQNTCLFFGEQMITRGLYAAQLAWWFQLFPPKNFYIINSGEFFTDPVGQLNKLNGFFGVEAEFKDWMTHSRGMAGKYAFKDPHKEEAKAYLREYYKRPNQELYKLLDEVGLGPFAPFEKPQKEAVQETDTTPTDEFSTDDASKEANEVSAEETRLENDARTSTASSFEVRPSSVFLIQSEPEETAEALPDREAPASTLLVLGQDIPFHKKPASEASFIFPGISRVGYYFVLVLLVIGAILWVMQSSHRGVRSSTLDTLPRDVRPRRQAFRKKNRPRTQSPPEGRAMKPNAFVVTSSDAREEDRNDEPVMELEIEDTGSEKSSEEITSEADELLEETSGSEIDLDVEARKGGVVGSLAEQAKLAQSEMQKAMDTEEESQEDEGRRLKWGSRSQFYGTNQSDQQGLIEMGDIQETLALQKAQLEQLDDADFDLPASVLPLETQKEEDDGAVQAVLGDGDALASLYEELEKALDEVRFKIGPLLEEARKGDLCTEQGLTYLEVKHLLLLHYCMCIMFYLMLKLEGKSIKDHPVVLRLVEIRAYLEKIRPMEVRLQPQVEKLLRAVNLAKESEMMEDEEASLAPHPEELVPKIQEGTQVYKAPKINPVAMEDDTTKKKRKSTRKKEATKDAMVADIVQEMTGAPEELPTGATPLDRISAILAERRASQLSMQEEDTYGTMTHGKQAKKQTAQARSETFGGVSFGDFTRDIQNAVDVIQASSSISRLPIRRDKPPVASGDADLPIRKREPSEIPDDLELEDNVERKPKKARKAKKASVHHSFPPKPPKTTSSRRAISSEIQKNRGLTPHRTRDRKNPRRRHRLHFESKEKQRKGQTRSSHLQAPDHYSGEASGISKRVKKSVRFS